MCMYNNHFAVHLKPAQHCKINYTLNKIFFLNKANLSNDEYEHYKNYYKISDFEELVLAKKFAMRHNNVDALSILSMLEKERYNKTVAEN